MKHKSVAVGRERKRDVKGHGKVERLLHAGANAVVIVLRLDDGDRNMGFVVKDVIGALGFTASDELSPDVRPLVKLTSSQICIIPSQPAHFTAGPMNLEQISRSLRSFLFIRFVALALEWAPGDVSHGRQPYIYA